jgi:hypothetical protein
MSFLLVAVWNAAEPGGGGGADTAVTFLTVRVEVYWGLGWGSRSHNISVECFRECVFTPPPPSLLVVVVVGCVCVCVGGGGVRATAGM